MHVWLRMMIESLMASGAVYHNGPARSYSYFISSRSAQGQFRQNNTQTYTSFRPMGFCLMQRIKLICTIRRCWATGCSWPLLHGHSLYLLTSSCFNACRVACWIKASAVYFQSYGFHIAVYIKVKKYKNFILKAQALPSSHPQHLSNTLTSCKHTLKKTL